jgi:hypothetical protein
MAARWFVLRSRAVISACSSWLRRPVIQSTLLAIVDADSFMSGQRGFVQLGRPVGEECVDSATHFLVVADNPNVCQRFPAQA